MLVRTHRKTQYHQPSRDRVANHDFSRFIQPLIINKDGCKRIIEDSASLIEAHPMFSQIAVGQSHHDRRI
jgi:hypothetical protein